jgi:hypothetical protein
VASVASDDLNGLVGRAHPVGHGQLVAQRAAGRLEESERHDDADPQEQLEPVLCRTTPWSMAAPTAAQIKRLAHHPADAKEGVED